MRALVTGASGQLGRELARTAPPQVQCIALDRTCLDVTDPDSVKRALDTHLPQIVINAAAYTAVDRAEQERERATAGNALAPGLLAEAARDRNLRLIHVSTDFVFDGTRNTPYMPNDITNPLGVYGATKREGELRVLATSADQAVIVRTGWVYAAVGNNFVNTMLRLMQERGDVGVVADQIGTPTWARGLARALWQLADHPDARGIYHWSDAGVASWFDFAVAIAEEARRCGRLTREATVRPIGTRDYPTPAQRPAYSVLDKTAIWSLLGTQPLHWRTALREMLCEPC
jgi:dTDP-4-dehydrorhamnose reductase